MLECDDEDFVAFVRTCRARGAEVDDLHVRAAELYLACSCLHGVPGASRRFHELVLANISRTIARIDPTPSFVAGIEQLVADKLLCGTPEPELARFTGETPLATWVRVYAIRVALEAGSSASVLGAHAIVDHDPELRRIHDVHGPQVIEYIRAALSRLGARERTSWRMHQIDQLSVEQISRLYRVHATTVEQWVEQARTRVRSVVLAGLDGTQGAAPKPRPSLLRLALSSTILVR